MHIAFLMQDTGTIYGAERATLDLVDGLLARNVSVTVILIHETRLNLKTSAFRCAWEKRDVDLEVVEVGHAFSRNLMQRVRAISQTQRISLLHTIGYKADLHGGFATKWGKLVPIVSTVHGWLFRPDPKEKFYHYLNCWALRRMTRVVVLSRYYEKYVRAKGISGERLVRIPSGYPSRGPRESTGTAPDRPVVLGSLGRLSWEKNQRWFLDVLVDIREQCQQPIKVILAGTGPERELLEQIVDERGWREWVEFPGFMEQHAFFDQIDVLVSCSVIENLPYAILEAMSAAKPVVATAVGGVPDLIDDGQTGYLVASDDRVAMAGRLVRLIDDSAHRVELGRAAREKLAREFAPDLQVQRHIELYQACLT